jgi:hypothetical protein
LTITGSGSSLVINGSQSAINSFLAGTSTGTLSYINNSDNPAALERLSMSVNDNGASGLGGALTTTAAYEFSVVSVNDRPVVSLSSSASAQALYAGSVGTALLSPQGTVSDADSSSFVSVQVQISTGFMAGDKLFLTTAASQTLSSAGFTTSFNASTGLLAISPATSGKVLSQEDVSSVLAGVSFSTTDAITAGESRVILYTVQDNSASATAASSAASLNLTLQASPFAAIQNVASVQTLVFTGDPRSDAVSVDLSTFRVLANGSPISVTGGNLFSVKDVDASGATATSVQLVGSSAANKLTGTSLGDTLTGGGGADTMDAAEAYASFDWASSNANFSRSSSELALLSASDFVRMTLCAFATAFIAVS